MTGQITATQSTFHQILRQALLECLLLMYDVLLLSKECLEPFTVSLRLCLMLHSNMQHCVQSHKFNDGNMIVCQGVFAHKYASMMPVQALCQLRAAGDAR